MRFVSIREFACGPCGQRIFGWICKQFLLEMTPTASYQQSRHADNCTILPRIVILFPPQYHFYRSTHSPVGIKAVSRRLATIAGLNRGRPPGGACYSHHHHTTTARSWISCPYSAAVFVAMSDQRNCGKVFSWAYCCQRRAVAGLLKS